ncbi:hypothetical protein MKX01_027105 [Papaver californicum]|nr:hypothetical protein MKX01_027105 [Papaver californicum]
MPWCDRCKKNTPTERGDYDGYLCCEVCGKVIDQDMFPPNSHFLKSQMCGNFVRSVESDYSESYHRTLNKGRDEISDMVVTLKIGGGDSVIDEASRFYKIAVSRNFTRGRRTAQVAAACLYITCRQVKLYWEREILMRIVYHSSSFKNLVRVVHICEATLTKRLVEFENTESGSLTQQNHARRSNYFVNTKTGKTHFAHGLCEACYDDFFILSGGLQGGSEPPAFQQAERERIVKAAADSNAEESSLLVKSSEHLSVENQDVIGKEKLAPKPSQCVGTQEGATVGHKAAEEGASYQPQCDKDMDAISGDESESVSDIDDGEEQAAKEAAAAAAKEAYMATFKNCPVEAQKLAAVAAAAVARTRKERQQKRVADAKNVAPPQTAAEATRQMLTKKRPSSKINYETTAEAIKKKRTEFDKTVTPSRMEMKGREEEELESDLIDNKDYEDYGYEDYGYEGSYYGNDDEDYGYEY